MRRQLHFPILIALLSAPLAAYGATVTVTSPNGGESWAMNSQHNITWTQTGAAGKTVRVVLRQGQNFIGNIATNIQATAGTIPWTVGALENGSAPAGSNYIIRVRNDDGTISDDSNAGFTVAPAAPAATLQLLAPNGGENWSKGRKMIIRWSAQNLPGNVKLELLQGTAVLGTIADNIVASAQALEWTVGDHSGGKAPIGDYTVRISAAAGTPKDESDATFKISFFIPIPREFAKAFVQAPKPDLVVCKYIPDFVPEGHTKERLWLKVFNTGTAKAKEHFNVRIYIQGAIEGLYPIAELEAGHSEEIYFPEYKYAASGPISYTIHVDVGGSVTESNETNNIIGGTIPRVPPASHAAVCSDGKAH